MLEELAAEQLDLNGFFEDDIASQTSKPSGPVDAGAVGASLDDSLSYGSHVCSISSDAINGFDVAAGSQWIYPSNLPTRSYQYNIVQKALFTNTLVTLPTGLGKTFIAAVVMYNFYRWYPSGKVIFLAPTKPLVAQQVKACYNVMGIPKEHTTEMTGTLAPEKRVEEWKKKRVFFLTPQVMQNDLTRSSCPADQVVCVVFDEAHKALGNHAYCQVIKGLVSISGRFRVLALTATPGDDLKAVQQVLTNLMISHIELRSEESIDIRPYVHKRKIDKVVVPLDGEIKEIRSCLLKILSRIVNRLISCKVLYAIDADKLSRYQLLQAREKFRSNPDLQGRVPVGSVEGDFAVSISLYHAFELLQVHGMRSFYQTVSQFLHGPPSRGRNELNKDPQLTAMLRRLRGKLEEVDGTDGTGGINSLSQLYAHNVGHSFFYSHPKLRKLEEIVLQHFNNDCSSSESVQTTFSPSGSLQKDVAASSRKGATRVMIFSQYRDSVKEIATMLSRHAPLIKAMSFVGQASSGKSTKGLTQKEQLRVVAAFRDGGYNTLVATCVGEEGLDIGDVDLIICFDAHNSPVRLIQRMGRTGRKRSGHIVVLVTEGKEERVYQQSQSNKKTIHRTIKDGCKSLQFYGNSYRMVPSDVRPQVCQLHMHIDEAAQSPHKATKSGTSHAKGKQQSRLSFGLYQERLPGTLNDNELLLWKQLYALPDKESKSLEQAVASCIRPSRKLLCFQQQKEVTDEVTTDNSPVCSSTTSYGGLQLSLDRWVEWQRAPASTGYVGHSSTTKHLVTALQFTENIAVSPDLGLNYDMEMQTFLNPDDIVRTSSAEEQASEQSTMPSSTIATTAHPDKRGKRKLFFDSEDEDFVVNSGNNKQAKMSNISSATKGLSYSTNVSPNCGVVDSTSAGGSQPTSTNNISLVPAPPDVDSLDWMDQLPPSQSVDSPPVNFSTPIKGKQDKLFSEFHSPSLVTPNTKLCDSVSSKESKSKSPSKLSSPTKAHSKGKLYASCPTGSANSAQKTTSPKRSTAQIKHTHTPGIISKLTKFLPNKTSPLSLKKNSVSAHTSVLATPTRSILTPVQSPLASSPKPPPTQSPSCSRAAGRPPPRDDIVDVVPESDIEYEETMSASGSHVRNKEAEEEDSFAVVHNKKRTNQLPEFLCTQLPPKGSPCARKRKLIDSSTDDDFTPIKKHRPAKHSSTEEEGVEGYLDLEAEVSTSSDVTMTEDIAEQDQTNQNVYDVDDSFINDATQLTQLPSRSPVNTQAMYRQSLISPNNGMFGGQQLGHGAKYRMRINRGHKLLHHFTGKAGIEISSRDQSHGNDSFTGSEAEEEYLPLSQDVCEDSRGDIVDITPEKPSNRRAVIMSPGSDCEAKTQSSHVIPSGQHAGAPPKKVLFSPPTKVASAGNRSVSAKKDVIVSPSLILTPPPGTDFSSPELACFSLGMDEWMGSEPPVASGNDYRDQCGSGSNSQQCPVIDSPSCKLLSSPDQLNSSHHLTLLVDSKEISNPQIVTLLKQKHHFKVVICQLGYVNYIVSNRTAIQRLMMSDLCTTANVRKAAVELSKVREMFDKIYVLVEKNSSKKVDISNAKMTHYDRAIAQLCQVDVILLFSQSPEETALLIAKVANSEQSSGFGISAPVEMDSMKQKVHQLLFTEPNMTYTTALALCHHYDTLHDIINCSPEHMQSKIPFISSHRAREICHFFRRRFNKGLC